MNLAALIHIHIVRIACKMYCCSVQVADDSTNTFVRALKDTITQDVCMVLVVLPTNRKDRYDAIKTICCIESPGN